jgi:hypothetical protein
MRALAAVVLALALPAAAQEEASDDDADSPDAETAPATAKAAGPQKPGDKLVALIADSVGTWKCTLRVTQPNSDPEDVPSVLKIDALVGGFAYAIDQSTQPKTGTATRMMAVWSQDPLTGKLTEAAWDSSGGSWRGTSVGPRGTSTVWAQDGSADGDALRMRTTWTRKNPKELLRVTEVKQLEGNRWVKLYEETCKR